MKLEVPLIRQAVDSVDCGLAGLAMILNYHGKKTSLEQLKTEIAVDEIGTYAPQLGNYVLSRGFEVRLVSLHPALFSLADVGMTQEQVMQRLVEKHELGDERRQMVIQHFIDFLEAGGEVQVQRPDEKIIREEIESQRPVCALLTSNVLNGKGGNFNFHFNVVIGIDEEHITVLDPMWDERGGEHSYSIEDFLYALYASAYGDLDNASLLLIQPKK